MMVLINEKPINSLSLGFVICIYFIVPIIRFFNVLKKFNVENTIKLTLLMISIESIVKTIHFLKTHWKMLHDTTKLINVLFVLYILG